MLLWEGKAKELGVDVDVLRTWYKSLRTRLGKLTQKQSGEGHAERTDRDKWILERLDFLVKHIHRVQGKKGAGVSTNFHVHYYYTYTFLKVLLILNLKGMSTSADCIQDMVPHNLSCHLHHYYHYYHLPFV